MALALLIACSLTGGESGAIDFNRDIRPILAQSCFPCHGFDERARKAKLRLDRAEFAYARRDEITPIVPRDLGASEVWRRINETDPDEVMPPPSSHRSLGDEQKARLRAWIEQGAPYAEHWAFIAPVRPPVPDPSGPSAPGNAGGAPSAIDAFVRARLAQEGLAPAPPAEPATLARRLFLDLTGLPPGADEVAAFVADPAPDAYSKLVERLLASPHFG